MHCNEARTAAALLAWTLSTAAGQTIGDYSRAQSAALERNMMQAIGRPLGTTEGATVQAPGTTLRAHVASTAASDVPDGVDRAVRRPTPDVFVNGVFSTRDRTLAEVLVDGVPYWLGEGDAVPRTSWALHKVSSGHVELERRAPGRPASGDRSRTADSKTPLPLAR